MCGTHTHTYIYIQYTHIFKCKTILDQWFYPMFLHRPHLQRSIPRHRDLLDGSCINDMCILSYLSMYVSTGKYPSHVNVCVCVCVFFA